MLRELETFLSEHKDMREKLLYAGVRNNTCLVVLNTTVYVDSDCDSKSYYYGSLEIRVRSLMWLFEQLVQAKIEWISFLHFADTEFTSDIFNTFLDKAFNAIRGDYLLSTGYGILRYLASGVDAVKYESLRIAGDLIDLGLADMFAYDVDNEIMKINAELDRDDFIELIKNLNKKVYMPFKKSRHLRWYRDLECGFADVELIIHILNRHNIKGFEYTGSDKDNPERDKNLYWRLDWAYDHSQLKNITSVNEAYKEVTRWVFKQFLDSFNK